MSVERTWRMISASRWYHPRFGMVSRRADGWYGFAPNVKVGPFHTAKDARHALGHAVVGSGGRRDPRPKRSRDVDTGFVRKHWSKTKGYYLLAGPFDPATGQLTSDRGRRIYVRTRSAETAEKFRRMGFRSLEIAWRLYKKKLADFDLY